MLSYSQYKDSTKTSTVQKKDQMGVATFRLLRRTRAAVTFITQPSTTTVLRASFTH